MLDTLTLDQWINALAAFGQVAAAILAVLALILSIATSRAQQRLARHIAGDEQAMLFEQIRNQRDSDIIAWTDRCVHCLAEIEAALAEPVADDCQRQRRELLTRLSALIDLGRMFFPNQTPELKGAEKPAAYQGYRQSILTVLVSAHLLLDRVHRADGETGQAAINGELADLRRAFVSEAQLAIDPRRFIALKEMNAIRAGKGLAPQRLEGADPAERFRRR